ncbi:MAG: DUF3795 domain-containing protein [Candidatus Moranbacteria bacterium]|nr:DUF3795 domain-containing protein [Candidatus Moranbacteria bacterium]
MDQKTPNKNLIAYCGLYCGECGRYLKGKCPGCQKNAKATWCKIRKCCIESGKLSCADCTVHATASECKKFNNMISKLFAFIFGSDREACINMIKEKGYDGYAEEMTKRGAQSLKKK